MALIVKAVGSQRRADLGAVRRAMSVLADPAHGFQLQAAPAWEFKTFKGTATEQAEAWVDSHSDARGIYYALNPVPPTLADRVKVGDVLARRWFLVDIDRPKTEENGDLSATDVEHDQARELATRAMDYLSGLDWPAPLLIDSGNGFHLLYRIDLPNDNMSKALLKGALKTLAGMFDGPDGKIGVECHDARRIARLPGTWSCRGEATAERPHRCSSLIFVPEQVEIVPAELISKIAQPAHQAPPSDGQAQRDGVITHSPFRLRAGGDYHAYAAAAKEREIARVLLAPRGDRNNQLNRSAFALGQLVAAGWIFQQDVEQALEFAATKAGLDQDDNCGMVGIRSTIRSGIEAGMKHPRQPPEERNGTHAKPGPSKAEQPKSEKKEGGPKKLTIRASEIAPKRVNWLWSNRIPKGFITVFAGRTGLGKSFVLCDLVARITRGLETPEGAGELFEPGSALFISEDPYEYMLAPRLIEMGADMDKVHFLTWESMVEYTLDNTEFLEKAFQEAGCPKLVAIDPPTNFTGEADEHKNSEVRQMLMHLVAWLNSRDTACVLITHNNKSAGKGVEALYRVVGSVAWTSTARIAHSFVNDPEDHTRCLFVPMKNNLGMVGKGLSYRISPTDTLAKVEWLGEVDTTADDAMNRDSSKPRRVVASEWLIDKFREKLEWPSKELFDDAAHEGVHRNAIFEAKNRLNLPKAKKVMQPNGDICWVWWVPKDWEHFQVKEEAGKPSDEQGF